MSVYEMGLRAPLYTCRGRAVGLLHAWQGGYAKTVSGYGKRVQHRPIRPLPSVYRCGNCGSTFSMELVFLRCLMSFAINVSPHLAPSQSMLPTRTGPRPMRVAAQSALHPLLSRSEWCGLITTIPGRDFRFAKAPLASKFAPGEFVIFSALAKKSESPGEPRSYASRWATLSIAGKL